jgi:dephospho-CoA kinase
VPVRLVLSGGIGSGKSTAAAIFAQFGATVFSADEFARRVLDVETAASAAVLYKWPQVGDAGVIDRTKLGRLVFADPEQLAALEAITHPPTRDALHDAVAAVPQSDVIVEMPILRDWFEDWTVVVVDAPDELRVERTLGRRDRFDESEIRAVMARQPSRAEWLLAADLVIDNRGSPAELTEQCRRVWERVAGV